MTWVTREIGDQAAAIEKLRGEGFDLRLDHSFRDRSPMARLRRRAGIDLRALRTGTAREEQFVCTPEVRRLVDAAREEFPDAVGAAAYWSATPVLERFAAGRRVYVVSDIDSMRERRGGGRVPGRVAAAERRALARVDLALMLSEEDREDALALLGGAKPPTFGRCPVSIEIPSVVRTELPHGDMLLYGHWEAPFNRDGLKWFLDEVWPVLRDHPDQPRLRLVGKGIPDLPADERIVPVGFVDDLAAEIARARAVLSPLRYASGMRYRLLESFAHGKCVIATTVAARGSGAEPGRHFLEADTPAAWLAALDRIDAAVAIDARRWVANNYSRERLAERWAAALSPVLSS